MNKQDGIILSLVYVLGVFWITLNMYFDLSLTLCPTKILLGIPCPGCGITRAIKLCFEGAVGAAIKMNPNIILVWILVPIAPCLLIAQLTTKKNYIGKINSFLNKKTFLFTFGILEGFIWINNIIRNI